MNLLLHRSAGIEAAEFLDDVAETARLRLLLAIDHRTNRALHEMFGAINALHSGLVHPVTQTD